MDDRQLRRIRALLAKAESTSFPLEAASLRAKARELMDRYGVTPVDLHRPPSSDPLREEPVPADGWGGVWTRQRAPWDGVDLDGCVVINGGTVGFMATATTNVGFGAGGIQFTGNWFGS